MEGSLDINVHDTYFVIPHFDIAVILSIVYFIYGFGYWLVQEIFKKRLVKILSHKDVELCSKCHKYLCQKFRPYRISRLIKLAAKQARINNES